MAGGQYTMLSNVNTVIYIITSDYLGIHENCEVYATESKMKQAFEDNTGFTWQEYLDGKYKFDDNLDETFYRCFEVILPKGQDGGFEVTLMVDIECYNRSLNVIVDRSQADKAAAIMDQRYNSWVEGKADDVGDSCCEEYILEGLKAANINFTFEYKGED